MSGLYKRCRTCRDYRPKREFTNRDDGECRACRPPVNSKRCIACGLVKPVDEFHKCRHSKDGRRNECNTCRNSACREDWRNKRASRRSQSRYNDDPVQQLIVKRWA